MDVPRIYRLIMPVDDIERAARFYTAVLGTPGERVWANRHYFHCGEVVLACVEAPVPARLDEAIGEQPWGERSFYFDDPFGNPLCFVATGTVYTGGSLE